MYYGTPCHILLLLCSAWAFAACAAGQQATAASGYTIDSNVCGFNVDSKKISLCANKTVCDKPCQVSICQALVRLGQAVPGDITDESLTASWPKNASSCDSMQPYAYCSWHGVSCCCLQSLQAAQQKPSRAICDWCQVVNSSRVGSVSRLHLKDQNLNGSLADIWSPLEALGQLGLFGLSLQGNTQLVGSLPARLHQIIPHLSELNLASTGRPYPAARCPAAYCLLPVASLQAAS
jgi:hypothetical protein